MRRKTKKMTAIMMMMLMRLRKSWNVLMKVSN